MTSRISELMDGELERADAAGAIEALRTEGEAREAWRTYHLIGDTMRDPHLLSEGFVARVTARLAAEPTVLAPRRPVFEQRRWQVLSAAASLAAVALVASVAFGPQEAGVAAPPVAQTAPQPTGASEAAVAQVAPPDAADEYLLAHQGYSPRNSLQGMAPYVRTVSSEIRGAKR